MRRALIIGAAPEVSWSFLKRYSCESALVICADGGRNLAEGLGLKPDFYVGDSDSGGHSGGCPADLLPSEKDVTDLDMAVSRALAQGCEELLLCGCSGGRPDHYLSAIGQLERILRAGKRGLLLSEGSEISLLTPGVTMLPTAPAYDYFGIIPLDEQLEGVTVTGAKYCVEHVNFLRCRSLGVSNEPLAHQSCSIRVEKGLGLLIRSNRN